MSVWAISGAGAITALGTGPDALFSALCAAECAIRAPSMWGGKGPVAAIPDGPHLGSALAITAARQAVRGFPHLGALAVVGASTAGDMVRGEEAWQQSLGGGVPTDPLALVWSQLCHGPTAAVVRDLGATGPSTTLSTACTSGTMALMVAASWLEQGLAPAVLVVGTDALCRTTVHGFGSLGVFGSAPCRPFDAERVGMSLGEGAAALLLEPAAAAAERGVEPLAWVVAAGSASDAYHLSTPHPEGRGAKRAIEDVLRRAGWAAGDVGYVNAHATGTELNDAMEARVLEGLLPGVPVSGIKGAIGHTLGAAGVVEALVTAMALRSGVLPPNVGMLRPGFALDLVTTARPVSIARALSVNFAFGGHNAVVALSRDRQ